MQSDNSSSLIKRHRNVDLNCAQFKGKRDDIDDRNSYAFDNHFK